MPLSLIESIARRRELVRDEAVLEGRCSLLAPADGDLVRAVWTYQQPTRQLASLAGVTPRAIRSRIRRLIRRLHSEEFLAAARVLPLLDGLQEPVARLHFCQGRSLRQTAAQTRLPYHQVRRLVQEVRGVMKVQQRQQAARASRPAAEDRQPQPDARAFRRREGT